MAEEVPAGARHERLRGPSARRVKRDRERTWAAREDNALAGSGAQCNVMTARWQNDALRNLPIWIECNS